LVETCVQTPQPKPKYRKLGNNVFLPKSIIKSTFKKFFLAALLQESRHLDVMSGATLSGLISVADLTVVTARSEK
jgi:hypothetical protein